MAWVWRTCCRTALPSGISWWPTSRVLPSLAIRKCRPLQAQAAAAAAQAAAATSTTTVNFNQSVGEPKGNLNWGLAKGCLAQMVADLLQKGPFGAASALSLPPRSFKLLPIECRPGQLWEGVPKRLQSALEREETKPDYPGWIFSAFSGERSCRTKVPQFFELSPRILHGKMHRIFHESLDQKNPHAHKNKIGTSTPPSKKTTTPPVKGGRGGFPAERTQKCQAPIKLKRAPESRAEILWTSRYWRTSRALFPDPRKFTESKFRPFFNAKSQAKQWRILTNKKVFWRASKVTIFTWKCWVWALFVWDPVDDTKEASRAASSWPIIA